MAKKERRKDTKKENEGVTLKPLTIKGATKMEGRKNIPVLWASRIDQIDASPFKTLRRRHRNETANCSAYTTDPSLGPTTPTTKSVCKGTSTALQLVYNFSKQTQNTTKIPYTVFGVQMESKKSLLVTSAEQKKKRPLWRSFLPYASNGTAGRRNWPKSLLVDSAIQSLHPSQQQVASLPLHLCRGCTL